MSKEAVGVLSVLVATQAACSTADSPTRSYAARDSSGVEVVTNHGARCTSENEWTLEPHHSYGEPEGNRAFGRVASIALDATGDLFVLDDLNQRVIVLNEAGDVLRTFGRAGDGPGEFRFPNIVGLLGEALIAVGDGAPSRLHILTDSGEFVRQIRLTPPDDAATTNLANVVADWSVVRNAGVWAALRMYSGVEGDSVPVRLVRFGASGEVADTILRWNLPGYNHRYEVWKSRWNWSIGSDGTVVTSPGHSHEVRFLWPTGRQVIGRRDVEPIEVSPALRTKLLELYFDSMEQSGESSEMVRQARQLAEVPTPFPAIVDLQVSSPSGNAWARSIDPDGDGKSATTSVHHVYAPTGVYLGCAATPRRFRVMLVTDSLVYGRWLDDLDVPLVRSYRVIQPEAHGEGHDGGPT